jgi:ParB family transcriptional regulator, chromosome partitioning protein
MLHELKIKKCYLLHIIEGKKTFEVRKNDRDFQVGDTIRFLPLEDDDYEIKTPLANYEITYILADFGGLQQGHVAMAIKPDYR